MKTNVKVKKPAPRTHEGAIAVRIGAEQELRRSVMSCLLWEDEFYESGVSIAERIASLVPEVKPEAVAMLAVEAREKMKLRHVPLLLIREMSRHASHRGLVETALAHTIQRPDELAEFLSIYWKEGRCPLAASIKRGLARAFQKFNAYSLAKYNRDGDVKLCDVLFMSHAKPENEEQAAIWKQLVDGTLPTPDTWEVALSAGGDKKEHWTRLLKENKLGALALLRNLRNMTQANVDDSLIGGALAEMNPARVLPFRFIAAARYAPRFEPQLEAAMFKSVQSLSKLPGKSLLLIDISGSMDVQLSGKSEMTRIEAASALAMIAREIGDFRVFTFSNKIIEVPPRRGFGLRDAISNSQPHGGTYLGLAVQALAKEKAERLIVITDEQSADRVPAPHCTGYMVNVASNQHGVGYGPWHRVNGWSESIVNYIRACEGLSLDVSSDD